MKNILYLGEAYNIEYKYYPGKEAKVMLKNNSFCIYVNKTWDTARLDTETAAAFKKWYIREADKLINSRLVYYSEILDLSYKDVRIKEQKTRWGSCSQKGNLNFNWRLVMAPLWVLDYVVIHELCHLKELNHSKDFWSLVENYCGNYKEAKQWLKENGAEIMLRL